jgi:hypothetical protein
VNRAAECLVRLVGAAALYAAAACADSRPPSAPSPLPPAWGVSGRVADFMSNTGVPGARISFSASAFPLPYTTSADSGGAYEMLFQNAGIYRVNVTSGSPPSASQIVYVPAARSYTTDLLVGPSDCPVMYGWVFDGHTSKVVSGARVFFADTFATSEADGSYRLSLGCRTGGYGTGTLSIGISHTSYVSQGFLGTRREFIMNSYQQRMDFALIPN